MKKILSVSLLALLTAGAWAENLQTIVFTPTPKMTCQNCEKKIKSNVRFVKGTKSIETSLENQTVTIVYDADKAQPADYVAAFAKIGREVELAQNQVKETKAQQQQTAKGARVQQQPVQDTKVQQLPTKAQQVKAQPTKVGKANEQATKSSKVKQEPVKDAKVQQLPVKEAQTKEVQIKEVKGTAVEVKDAKVKK